MNSLHYPIRIDQREEIADRAVRLDWVAKMLVHAYPIAVSPAGFFATEKAALIKLCDDPLDCPLGDADSRGYFAKYERRIAREQDQDVRMIRQEAPFRWPSAGFRRAGSCFRIVA